MKKNVVILGAGFGGLELSTRLSESLADEVRVTLIDKNDSFVFGSSKLDVMFGRKKLDDVRLYYRDVRKPGVEFRQELVTSIDPASRHVTTDAGSYEADVLVVALGADYAPEATPGFVAGGLEFYSVAGAERMREVLPSITSGRILVAILGLPFKCPPAPFESVVLLHDLLVERGVRERTPIRLITPLDSPLPVSPETAASLTRALEERDIEYSFSKRVTSIDPASKVASLDDGSELPYDVFIGIPVHKTPDVVQASGLTEGGIDGWVKVSRTNLETPHPNVYAIGDLADAPVPRAGVFAENAARPVASDIAAKLHGGELDRPFEGRGTCYIEFGGGKVGKVDVDFLSGPNPTAPFSGPSIEFAREKEEFAASRRRRWFGA